MARLRRLWRLVALGLAVLTLPTREVSAYSVLAHEAMVDVSWSDHILPALKQRFPRASSAELDAARAYAYGGSLIQDLGYYPFGSHFFSNLVHYVRSGDFVEALVRDASDPNEYAFALGALAHYSSDNAGHPFAVNLVVPVMYPKLGTKYGPQVLYADSPARHVMVEFAFDVMEVGRRRFRSDEYQSLIGFQVSVPLLERAFRETYGLDLREVLGDADLAIGTFRHAASELIPQVTRAAWKEKQDDILAANPTLAERDVVYSMTRAEDEQAFGTTYRKPGFLARFVVTVFKLLPKFGPFKPLAFQPLTPPTERMFLDSFERARTQYREYLTAAQRDRLALRDSDLDTGAAPLPGVNPLADETYDELLAHVAKGKVVDVTPALRKAINDHYSSRREGPRAEKRSPREEKKVARYLAALNMR